MSESVGSGQPARSVEGDIQTESALEVDSERKNRDQEDKSHEITEDPKATVADGGPDSKLILP